MLRICDNCGYLLPETASECIVCRQPIKAEAESRVQNEPQAPPPLPDPPSLPPTITHAGESVTPKSPSASEEPPLWREESLPSGPLVRLEPKLATQLFGEAAVTRARNFQPPSIPAPPPSEVYSSPPHVPLDYAPLAMSLNNTLNTPLTRPEAESKPSRGNTWGRWFALLGGILLLVAVVWLVKRSMVSLTTPLSEKTAAPAPPVPLPVSLPPPTDLIAQSDAHLREAEERVSQGEMTPAIETLRKAVALNQRNFTARRRLGDLLWQTGEVEAAIQEYSGVVSEDKSNALAWLSLGQAELTTGRADKAVQSFETYFSLSTPPDIEDTARYDYATALRLDGNLDKSQQVFGQLINSSDPDLATAALSQLRELQALTKIPDVKARETKIRDTNTEVLKRQRERQQKELVKERQAAVVAVRSTPRATPRSTPRAATAWRPVTVQDHYSQGIKLWNSNRDASLRELRLAQSMPDANYFLGLSYAQGRDPALLKRAALVAALIHFQHAQYGTYRAQAKPYLDRLGREYDRRAFGQ